MKSNSEILIKQFELYYPDYYNRVIDWWKSGPYYITFLLDNNDRIEFDGSDNTIRWIRKIDRCVDSDEFRKEIGRNIKKFIIYKGLNQQEVSERVGITPAMLSRYITGTSIPGIDKINKLANVLGCRVGDLIGDYID